MVRRLIGCDAAVMSTHTAPGAPDLAARNRRGGRRAFTWHFVEMLLVMFIGMGVCSGLAALAYGVAGSSLTDQPGEWRVILMGINMTIPMVLWMTYRGHSLGRNAEMAAAMLVPSFAAAALIRAGVVEAMGGLTIQHVVMVPAMLGVMLWRYDEYAHGHRAHP